MTASLADAGARLLGGELLSNRRLYGGDLSEVLQLAFTDGRQAIVKAGPAPAVEAAMLDAMGASGAPVPAVLAADDHILAIEVLPAHGRVADAWGSLGTALALLHGETGTRYGWSDDYAFGAVTIPNSFCDNWPRFWAERRLLNNLAHLPSTWAPRIEGLAAQLEKLLPAAPMPALLHGDLWGGNILVTGNRVSGLIDPACYYGHAEVDIGMLSLFDSPDPAFFEAYRPMQPGWLERQPIYQLWPALVHLRLFGSGYAGMVDRLLSAVGF